MPWNKFCMIWVIWHLPVQMALPEGLEVEASYLAMILAEEGYPQQKFKKISLFWKDF